MINPARQLGRRNLPPDSASLLRGRRYNRAKRQGARTDLTLGHSGPKSREDTAERLAEQPGVGSRTIKRDGRFAAAVETLKPTIPDIEQRIMRGAVPSREAVVAAAKAPETARAALDTAVHVGHNSGNNEWYTPVRYIEAARKTMGGIDCDPASSDAANRTVKATTWHTAEANGLMQPWGARVLDIGRQDWAPAHAR
jgi:hypothetical protein